MSLLRRFVPVLLPLLALGVFLGGAALGDRRKAEPVPVLAPLGEPVAAASAADPGLDPEDVDPDAPPPATSVAAALVPVATDGGDGQEADLAVAFDADTGVGSGAAGPPYVPPGVDPTPVGEPDPDEPDSTSTTAAPGADETTTTAGAADTEPDAEPDADPDEERSPFSLFLSDLGGLGWLRFLDPCAEADADPDACPDGTGGTVLLPFGGDGDPLPELQIGTQIYDAIAIRDLARCPLGGRPDGSVDLMLSTNIPVASLEIVFRLDGEEVDRATVATSDDERDRFLARRLAGQPLSSSPGGGVLHCFRLEGFTSGGLYRFPMDVRALDDAGHEVAGVATLWRSGSTSTELPTTTRGRPPITVATDPDKARLGVPVDDARESVYVAVLPRNGDFAVEETCSEVEALVLGHRWPAFPGLIYQRPIPLAHSAGSPFDARFDAVEVFDIYAGEGASLEVCTWITTPAARSFDLPPVVQRHRHHLQAPRHLRTSVHLVRARLDEAVPAGGLTIAAADWPAPRETAFPDEPLRAGYTVPRTTVQLIDSGAQPHGDTTRLRITGPSGRSADVLVPTPNACTAGEGCTGWRTFDVLVPGPAYEARLCGGFGSCDPPAGSSIGELTLAVHTYAGPGGAPVGIERLGKWARDDLGSFAAGARAAAPPNPQVDFHTSRATVTAAGPGERPDVVLRLSFDRAVDVEVDLVMPVDHPCYQPPQRSAGAALVQTFRWPGACFQQTYAFGVLATAADGGTFDVRTVVDGVPTGRAPLFSVQTPGFPITSWEYEVRFLPDEAVNVLAADVVVDGSRLPLVPPGAGGRSGCPTRPLPLERALVVRNAGGYPITFGDPLVVRLTVRARTCDGEEVTLDLSGRPTLAQALSGPFTLSGSGDAGSAEVTITVTPRSPLAP